MNTGYKKANLPFYLRPPMLITAAVLVVIIIFLMAAEGGIRKYLNEKKIQKKAREELELRKEAK